MGKEWYIDQKGTGCWIARYAWMRCLRLMFFTPFEDALQHGGSLLLAICLCGGAI